MIENNAGFEPYELRTSMIRVTSYARKNLQGYLINPYFGKDVYFENLTQLLFLIEDMLDDLNCPQRGMERRKFQAEEEGPRAVDAAQPPESIPMLASFKISILFRQNASWQGSISWIERSMQSQFRSVLELLALLDGVLSEL